MYENFTPGRNIWKKVGRWLFMTMERVGILVVMFMITYGLIKTLYPYNIGWFVLILIVSNLFLTVFLVLPSPSNPNGLMYQEILRGLFKLTSPATVDAISVTERKEK